MPPVADPQSLRLVVGLWAGDATGLLQFDGSGEPCRLERGRPLTERDEQVLAVGLAAAADFTEREPGSSRARGDAGPILLAAARERAEPRKVARRLGALLVGGRWLRAALGRLDLDPGVDDLVRLCLAEPAPLRLHLASLDLDARVVARDLAALRELKLIGFRPYPTQAAEAAPPSTVGMRAIDSRALERRLHLDWVRLESASDAVVLGAGPSMDPELVRRMGDRQLSRYRSLEIDTGLSAEGRALAAKLARRVQKALEAVSGRANARAGDLDLLLTTGRELIDGGKLADARRAFESARSLDPGSDEVAGWLALTVALDPALNARRRESQGLKEVLRALARSPHSPALHEVAAWANVALQKAGPARRFAQRAQELAPGDPAIARLVSELPR